MKRVLVVVDYQNDFVDGVLGFNQSENISQKVYEKVIKALNSDTLVIFTKDTHYQDTYKYTREGKFLPIEHCIKGTKGHALYGQLSVFDEEIAPNVIVLEKETFGSMDLPLTILEYFGSQPDEIEFCGVVTNICVISNVIIAMSKFRDTKIRVYEDATAAMNEMQFHTLKVLEGLGVEII